MTSAKWHDIIEQLKGHTIEFAPALTDAEIAFVESKFSFSFLPTYAHFFKPRFLKAKNFPTGAPATKKPFATGWTSRDAASCSMSNATLFGFLSGANDRSISKTPCRPLKRR